MKKRVSLALLVSILVAACSSNTDTETPLPQAPLPLPPTAVTQEGPKLSWAAVAGATGYAVYANCGSDTHLCTEADKISTAIITGTTFDLDYNNPKHVSSAFRVAACNTSGCGTLSDTSTATVIATLAMSAATATEVTEGQTVSLLGRASPKKGKTVASWQWSRFGNDGDPSLGREPITIVNADKQNASFVAPKVSQPTRFAFMLLATDNTGAAGSEIIVTTVRPIDAPLVSVVNKKMKVTAGNLVYLHAVGSDRAGTYSWKQVNPDPIKATVAEPTKVLLQNANTANPSFVAPAVTNGLATLAFQVTHTSAQGKSASTTVSVSVTGAPIKTVTEAAQAGTLNQPLTVPSSNGKKSVPPQVAITLYANPDATAIAGATTQVSINATGGNGILSYSWRQIGGTTATLNNTTGAILRVTAPAVTTAEVLSFEMTVRDSVGKTATGIALVTVQPKAIESPPLVATLPTTVVILPAVTATPTPVVTLPLSQMLSGQRVPIQGFGSDVASTVLTQTGGRAGNIQKFTAKEWLFEAPTISGNSETLELSLQVNYTNGTKKILVMPVLLLTPTPVTQLPALTGVVTSVTTPVTTLPPVSGTTIPVETLALSQVTAKQAIPIKGFGSDVTSVVLTQTGGRTGTITKVSDKEWSFTAPDVPANYESIELSLLITYSNGAKKNVVLPVQVLSLTPVTQLPAITGVVASLTTTVTTLPPATGTAIPVETLAVSQLTSKQGIPIKGFGSDVASVVLTQTGGRAGTITKVSDKEWSFTAPEVPANFETIELSIQINYASGSKKILVLPVQVLSATPVTQLPALTGVVTSVTTPVTTLPPVTVAATPVATLATSQVASEQIIPIKGFGSDVASVVLTQTGGRAGFISKVSDKEWSFKAPTVTVGFENIELSLQITYSNGAKKIVVLPVQVISFTAVTQLPAVSSVVSIVTTPVTTLPSVSGAVVPVETQALSQVASEQLIPIRGFGSDVTSVILTQTNGRTGTITKISDKEWSFKAPSVPSGSETIELSIQLTYSNGAKKIVVLPVQVLSFTPVTQLPATTGVVSIVTTPVTTLPPAQGTVVAVPVSVTLPMSQMIAGQTIPIKGFASDVSSVVLIQRGGRPGTITKISDKEWSFTAPASGAAQSEPLGLAITMNYTNGTVKILRLPIQLLSPTKVTTLPPNAGWVVPPPVEPLALQVGSPRVDEGTKNASISANASGGTLNYTYSWTYVPSTGSPYSAASLNLRPNGNHLVFDAPVLTTGGINLNFIVKVDDGKSFTSKTMSVNINDLGDVVASNGNDLRVPSGQVASLSFPVPSGGVPPYSYAVTQVSGTTVALTGANTLSPSFTAPTLAQGAASTQLAFEMTVTDAVGNTVKARENVAVEAPVRFKVTLDAVNGPVTPGTAFNLHASAAGTSVAPITYTWAFFEGRTDVTSQLTLTGATTDNPGVTVPAALAGKTLRVGVSATDSTTPTAQKGVASPSIILQVGAAPAVALPPLSLSFIAPSGPVPVDTPFDVTYVVTQADPSVQFFEDCSLPGGVDFNHPTMTIPAQYAGQTVTVTCTVEDENGNQVSGSISLTVDAAAAVPQGPAIDQTRGQALACVVCGDPNTGTVCRGFEAFDDPVPVPAGSTQICMTTLIDNDQGQRGLIKFVAPSTAVATSLWWDQTSDNNGGCMTMFNEQLPPNGQAVTCHYACVETGCNKEIYPEGRTLYIPPGGQNSSLSK
jgi:hypothetical protein